MKPFLFSSFVRSVFDQSLDAPTTLLFMVVQSMKDSFEIGDFKPDCISGDMYTLLK